MILEKLLYSHSPLHYNEGGVELLGKLQMIYLKRVGSVSSFDI